MSTIITVPHPALRDVATTITAADKKTLELLKDLDATLRAQTKPQGVGLAAPQLAIGKQAFVTFVGPKDERQMQMFINPKIADHSEEVIFGETPDDEDDRLEGCLSIPGLYGPVPRFIWVDMEFQELEQGELVTKQARFSDFHARVIQHEFDHLNGVLFTDYSLEYDLPVYREDPETEKLVEIDKRILEAF